SLLAISVLRLLYLQTSSSSGDRRVAAPLAPPPYGRMKCVAASVSGRGGDPRVVRSCRVIKSGFVGVERSALSVVSLEVEVIVRCAVGNNDKSRSEAPEVVGLMQALCARFIVSSIEFS
ncbi:unnamed protein product, partial [Brassica oleracea var. botrytis]